MKVLVRLIVLAVAAAACGDTSSNPPLQLNLDRPVDITFACYGGLRITNGAPATIGQPVEATAQPVEACNIRSGPRETGAPVPLPGGQEDLTAMGGPIVIGAAWYAFILQSAPGTVAIAAWGTKPAVGFQSGDVDVLDADRLTPGKNSISVGEDPIAIATDRAGCKAITANAGSCDLSVLDINDALDQVTGVDVQRLEVTNANGVRIRSRPAAMVAEPMTTTIGNSCPALDGKRVASGLVYVAYPSCNLVAGIELSTGRIVTGVQLDADGDPTIVTGAVTCPDECGAGAAALPGARPTTLDLEEDPRTGRRRLVIGAENSRKLSIVDLDLDSRPLQAQIIALEDPTGTLGVTAVALSPEIGMGGESHDIDDENAPGGDFQFIYAVSTDGTVRVADVLNVNTECDTQVDPRFLRDGTFTARDLSCFSVGALGTPPRRPGARGPGIELVGDVIPTSVDFFRSRAIEGDVRPEQLPGKLIGTFAIVTALNGASFVVNVDDDDYPDQFDPTRPLAVPVPLSLPHGLRDAVVDRGRLATQVVEGEIQKLCEFNGPTLSNGGVEGGPRAATSPSRNVAQGAYALEKLTQLPGIRQLRCEGTDSTRAISELSFSAPEDVRDREFPDLRALRIEETWTLTWEGALSVDKSDSDVDGPIVREGMLFIDQTGMHLRDQTRPYCDAGVEPFDIVQMRGCDPALGNSDCPLTYRCYVHPTSQVQGLGACILDNEAERLADACKDFLTSIRRYTVARAESGELLLMPRRHELRTTPIDGCTDDTQCEALGDYAARTQTTRHPIDDQMTVDPHQWVCRADPTRKPRGTGNRRCNMACDISSDCATGTVCAGGNPATAETKEGLCMEGITPAQSCVNAPQRYELRAAEAFLVAGTRSGYVHSTIADATGACRRDATAHPLLIGRIPLTAPPCDPTADPISGRLPGGGYEPNPCSTTVSQTDVIPNYEPDTCTLAVVPSDLVERQAPAIQFRNRGMNLNIVDPYYPGDNRCIADRGGSLVNVPVVFPGYQLTFRQTGGFTPLVVPVSPSMPTKVVRGPTQSIWIIDEGDFLSTSIAQPSTRGKVFRIEVHALGLVNTLE